MLSYWNLVLEEVLDKDKTSYRFINRNSRDDNSNSGKKGVRKKAKKYFLGAKYPQVFFTEREAQSMVQLLKGKTISMVALEMGLSARTVEFYVKKMKEKLDCRTKAELIGRVVDSDFLKNIDFEDK